jgi:hypothetical protein
MKALTVRLPEVLAAQIEAEARARGLSMSGIIRERLSAADAKQHAPPVLPDAIADLIGSVDGLPNDLSPAKKKHIEAMGYGRKRAR